MKKLPSDRQLNDAARRFKVLSEPMRLRILRAICRGPKNVSAILEEVGGTQANVSKHLALLYLNQIVHKTRQGNEIHYGIVDQLMLQLCELVCQHGKG